MILLDAFLAGQLLNFLPFCEMLTKVCSPMHVSLLVQSNVSRESKILAALYSIQEQLSVTQEIVLIKCIKN